MPASIISRLTLAAALGLTLCTVLAQPAMAETTSTVGTIELSPQAVSLANPTQATAVTPAQLLSVKLTLLDTDGNPITSGALTTPVTITIYGPSPAVLTTSTTEIHSATPTVDFTYDGHFVANSVFVTAVSGSAFAQMAFQPKHRGFAGTQSVPFRMKAKNIKNGWSFKMAVAGGAPHGAEMDTGSHGVVVPLSALGPDAVGPGPAGQIEYSSDGKIFTGFDYLASVTLTAGGRTVTTVPIKVLAVSAASCDPAFPKCKPGNPESVHMLGIGFDRGKATNVPSPTRAVTAAPSGTTPPELANAFMALTDIVQGSMRPGYVITPSGVTLGITAANTRGFKTIGLTPGGTGPGDWNAAPGCFSFPGIPSFKPQCGTVLVDTGIDSAILQLAASLRPRPMQKKKLIPAHTPIRISVGPSRKPGFSYGFTTGGTTPVTPTSIRWAAATRSTPPFVNTGRDVISRYDYLFDAGSGKVGFRKGR